MIHLTEPQERLLAYIKGCERPPSFDEMVDGIGCHSKSYVTKVLEALERKGYVRCLRRGGYRVHRGITANEGPRPDLAGYTYDELADEMNRRLAA